MTASANLRRLALLVMLCASCSLAHSTSLDDPPANPIVSLSVSAPQTQILTGGSVQLSVQGTFTDGTRSDVTADSHTSYDPSASAAVVISPTGLIQGAVQRYGPHRGYIQRP